MVGLHIKDKLALSRNQLTLREAVPPLVPKMSNHHKIQKIKNMINTGTYMYVKL